jgi:uroporphyrinogen III methyltransferase/synthase
LKELERKKGKVYIVGAGPGDPGLVTVKGIRCIEEAEVIVFDHLVNEELLSFARPDVRLIYAGKQGGDHTLVQDEINRILVDEASQGCVVTRLKGGDPLIFGRGGEEALVLKEAGIPFEIVPGVSSAIAVPAYAGISLTQRGYTSPLAFVCRQAGGASSDGERDILDIEPQELHQRVPLFIGSKNDVRVVNEIYARHRGCSS